MIIASRSFALVLLLAAEATLPVAAQYTHKTNIAHRGASAYAPEHTIAAYALAIEQRADYVEQDLQVTRDGVLVCLHDLTLERTTNVEAVFPDRYRIEGGRKVWPVVDFIVAEIKQLEAGSWFDPRFAGERVPTFEEAIAQVRGRAGLFPETKAPHVYGSRGFDMEALLLAALEKHGLARPAADPKTPVIIQSFSAESLRRLRALGSRLPLVLLIEAVGPGGRRWLTDEGLREARAFADGIGPAKGLLLADPTLAPRARAAGLSITPYTFRAAGQPAGRTVRDEMARFLYEIGVDAVFTDNPDQFPRR
ncbi:MAG TPA: glycerophosphodiester phosphodiesterase family protein [Vicinamibacterales bacterium]|nr:glycerophosphodiester phosphodiesterase family protein [Vicinamibacterales bacterium]